MKLVVAALAGLVGSAVGAGMGIDEPLAIVVKLPAVGGAPLSKHVEPVSSAVAPSSSLYVAPASTSEHVAPTSTSEYVAPTSEYVAPTPSPAPATTTPPIISSSSSSLSSSAPAPSSGTGDIPDGQGNTFAVPAGAVRFPWNYNNADKVVPITPQSSNGGWAMSPNQQCMPNSWCPYACAPGYYSAQWDPAALLYNGVGSMNGGLYADASGKLTKPYPSKPFCSPGMFNAAIKNTLGQSVSACQTVYPGNEAMIIPSVASAGGSVDLNVVPHTYWLGTSSQFYVNLAGSTGDQCIWGNADKPVGNWAPFIFGGGQGADGNTYISVQYNLLYTAAGFKTTDTYNVKIQCESGQCNFPTGGQCQCAQGVCSVDNGCTVTLTGDAKASFVIY
ncbi:hypothetical protein H4S02_005153 [Coemansia sp. RSA 2611]|nr:hypothetical protein H4S01_000462 [Coemansia sp. RSA 2610]KAJ2383750.1 hypothetical protein H4S02_005153 [Coemansia sp. RSA 2611]